MTLKLALLVTLVYSSDSPSLSSIDCAVPENVITVPLLVNTILPSLVTLDVMLVDCEFIGSLKSKIELLTVLKLLYVPALIPKSLEDFLSHH